MILGHIYEKMTQNDTKWTSKYDNTHQKIVTGQKNMRRIEREGLPCKKKQ